MSLGWAHPTPSTPTACCCSEQLLACAACPAWPPCWCCALGHADFCVNHIEPPLPCPLPDVSFCSIPVPEWFSSALKSTRTSSSSGIVTPTAALTGTSSDAKLKAGLYGVVRSLLRVLEKGVIGKHILDTVLDACSAMQVRSDVIDEIQVSSTMHVQSYSTQGIHGGTCMQV